MLLLAIESSCDETAAAVVQDGSHILSNIVFSQIASHAVYGGVVPEIASRKHMEAVVPVVEEALHGGGVPLSAVEGIAVTQGPGLAGALLVGVSLAKALAYVRNIPLVGIHHIEGHILAILLENKVELPFLALVVSGGHTHFYQVDGIGRYLNLGQTLDDAAGEAFDKVAKLLGLPYPGGVEIDRLATLGDPLKIIFPRPLLHDKTCNVSFSGLKTAVLNHIRGVTTSLSDRMIADISASFQRAVCDILVSKTRNALRDTGINRVIVAGGVASNKGLRSAMIAMGEGEGVEVYFPSPHLCTDNAAMIAVPGNYYLENGMMAGNDLDALPTWRLETRVQKMEG